MKKPEGLGAADHSRLPAEPAASKKDTPSYKGSVSLTIEGLEIGAEKPLFAIGTEVKVVSDGQEFVCTVDLVTAESPKVRRWRARS